jgi:excisionase family DNA binding protein
MIMTVLEREPVQPMADEESSLQELDRLFSERQFDDAALIGADQSPRRLPPSVVQALAGLVHELARGNAVTVVPVQAELTTQQAADLLNVSRPFLVKLLDSGEIPYHRTGTHRRVKAADLLEYRDRRRAARRAALAELTREAQAMGFYE